MTTQSHHLTRAERGISLNLASLFSLRMLGIFIIIPIFAQHAASLEGVTPFLAGLFMSGYALTQIILQPIFGMLSDKFGRKETIVAGLLFFVIGSAIIAFTSNIHVAILGRIIQGTGAIGAVILALATDLTREEVRSKVMAIIGITIGLTFGVAFFISPKLYAFTESLGFSGGLGVFLLCAILGVLGILLAWFMLPTPPKIDRSAAEAAGGIENFKAAFKDGNINRLYFGGMMVHMILTLAFTAFPFYLIDHGFDNAISWRVYVPGFLISIILLFPIVGFAERFYHHRKVFLMAIGLLGLALMLTFFKISYGGLLVVMMLFFLGFNTLEAMQPSLMSRFAPADNRGMVMGIFSSSQFIGIAVGGQLGMQLRGSFESPLVVFFAAILLVLAWLYVAYPMKNPVRKPKTDDPLEATAAAGNRESNEG